MLYIINLNMKSNKCYQINVVEQKHKVTSNKNTQGKNMYLKIILKHST